MSDSSTTQELWIDEDIVWERDTGTGAFRIDSIKHIPFLAHSALALSDIGSTIGCPNSSDPADCGSEVGQLRWFPRNFRYSPVTGKPLNLPSQELDSWLPPFGNQSLPAGALRGSRLTGTPLRIEAASFETRPDTELALPQLGEFRFCTGAFGTKSSHLLAMEPGQGLIFCFLPSSNQWVEVTPAEGNTSPGDFTGTFDAWGIGTSDLVGSDAIFWASDRGIQSIRLNLLSMTYEIELICDGKSLTAPVLLGGQIHALVEKAGEICVLVTQIGSGKECKRLELANPPTGQAWRSPFVTARDIFWLSDAGYISIRSGTGDFYKWPVGAVPLFELGSIHASSDGKFWQLCECLGEGGESGVAYIQIARTKPEIRAATPRTLTGVSSVKMESWLPGEPWIEPELIDGGERNTNETVIPLVESLSSKTLLCLRVENAGNLVEIFEKRGELLTTTFQIMNQNDENGFFRKKMAEPWRTRPFVFDRTLFLYHPSMNSVPGWTLAPST